MYAKITDEFTKYFIKISPSCFKYDVKHPIYSINILMLILHNVNQINWFTERNTMTFL